jgi:hypothetical protein
MAATAERLADGRVRLNGTISPAQPGRKVRLDRREKRVCDQGPVGPPRPSSVDTPANCFDIWSQKALATAAVSADGASFTIDGPAAAGATLRVALDAGAGQDVYAGETAPIAAP